MSFSIFFICLVCGTTGKRKACKNCSCGLAEELSGAGEGDKANGPSAATSSCGNVSVCVC